MSMIEDIKRDREASYDKGSWKPHKGEYQWWAYTASGYPVCSISGCDYEHRARRIARVPDMEAALIAAEELADAVSALTSRPDSANGGRLILTVDVNRAEQKLAAYRAATGAA